MNATEPITDTIVVSASQLPNGGLKQHAWGIPTRYPDGTVRGLGEVRVSVDRFIHYAEKHIDKTFQIGKIGLDDGFRVQEIGPLFAATPMNCSLPSEFESYRKEFEAFR